MRSAVSKAASPTHEELLDRGCRAIAYGRQIREALDITFDQARELREEIEVSRQAGTDDGRGGRK